MSDRVREAAVQIGQIIGLQRTEFTQTMVLPQGRFAQFLTAPAEERTTILRELFGTEMYARLQTALTDGARQAEETVATSAKRAARAMMIAWEHAANHPRCQADLPERDRDIDDMQLLGDRRLWQALEQATTTAARYAASARAREESARASAAALQNERERRAACAERQARGRAAIATTNDLAAIAPDIARRRAHLDLQGQLRALDAACQEVRRAVGELDRAAAAIDMSRPPHPDSDISELVTWWQTSAITAAIDRADKRAHAIAAAVVRAQAEATQLDELQARADQLTKRVTKLADRRREVGKALAQSRHQRATLPSQIATLSRKYRAASADAKRLGALERTRDQASERVKRIATLHTRRQDATHAEAQRTQLGERHREAVAAYETLAARWAATAAARLAGQLQRDTPCPVCGSPTHPAPATASEELIELADVQQANQQAGAALEALSTADANLAALQAEIAELEADLDGDCAERAAADLQTAEVALAAALHAASAAPTLETELRAAREALAVAHSEVRSHAAAMSALTGDWRAAQREAREINAKIRTLLGDAPSLASYRQDLRERADASAKQNATIKTARNAAAALAHAFTHLEQQRSHVCAAPDLQVCAPELGAQATARQLGALLLADADAKALKSEVDDYDARLAAAKATLADPQVRTAMEAQTANVAALDGPLRQARADAANATAAAATAQHLSRQLQDAYESAREVHGAYTKRSREVADAIMLGQLARGDNPHHLTLATYVLIDMFDEVLAATNIRLLEISEGRYELQRRLQRESGRQRRLGLALQVWDHAHDQTRSLDSLSGGETFYTALSLALGLADCVRAAHGGIEMNTLFIDEGFGALDGHTLDTVMARLHELQQAGRLVGVVSHVEDMRQRISTRIEVSRLDRGISTLTVVGA
ncbi:MAG: SMC family ATPase [Bowdeniella nasicola]|nr:SMC family ATPase [Bowdeniella nasicola]